MTNALVLCRTPFQASLVPEVLRAEGIDEYALLYYTQHDTEEDRTYYRRLSARAKDSLYVYVRPLRYDVLGHLLFRLKAFPWLRDRGCRLVLAASINNLLFGAIIRKQRSAALITFDDGMANILSGDYHQANYTGRAKLYRILFRAHTLAEIRSRIVRHYTIYPQRRNIVPPEKLRPLRDARSEPRRPAGRPHVFFIGQPFREAFRDEQIRRLTAYLRTRRIDFYVKHPRETQCLDLGVPHLDKKGLIAEEAIFAACNGAMPKLIGCFSGVLANVEAARAQKEMVIFRDAANRDELEGLARATGCEVVVI